MAAWKIGDVVQLKSGGPLMTIDNVGMGMGGDQVRCVWFDGKRQMSENFSPEALMVSAGPALPTKT